MRTEALRIGKWTISVLYEGDKCAALAFLTNAKQSTQLKFTHLFNETIEHGPPKAQERFRHLWNGIHEFKTYDGYRMFCLVDREERHIILTHGSKKPNDKQLKTQVGRAEEMRAKYLETLKEEQG